VSSLTDVRLKNAGFERLNADNIADTFQSFSPTFLLWALQRFVAEHESRLVVKLHSSPTYVGPAAASEILYGQQQRRALISGRVATPFHARDFLVSQEISNSSLYSAQQKALYVCMQVMVE
jgi:hypothetical protein